MVNFSLIRFIVEFKRSISVNRKELINFVFLEMYVIGWDVKQYGRYFVIFGNNVY